MGWTESKCNQIVILSQKELKMIQNLTKNCPVIQNLRMFLLRWLRKNLPKKEEKKKKNRVKRAISAYMFFAKEMRPKVAETTTGFAEIAREISKRWGALTEEDKQPFKELNEQDKIRYAEELANAPPPESDSEDDQPKKKKKKKRDPNMPKRPMTAFFFFLNKNRAKVTEEFPDMKVSDRSKVLGERWRALSPEDKQEFIDLNIEAKAEYKIAMEKYKKDREGGD